MLSEHTGIFSLTTGLKDQEVPCSTLGCGQQQETGQETRITAPAHPQSTSRVKGLAHRDHGVPGVPKCKQTQSLNKK